MAMTVTQTAGHDSDTDTPAIAMTVTQRPSSFFFFDPLPERLFPSLSLSNAYLQPLMSDHHHARSG